MAAGLTGVRRNVATISSEERARLRDAILALNRRFYPGKRTDPIPGGVTFWFKQDEIHQATHIHGGAEFLPWHRELCNRFEASLRQIDSTVSLHYWDWTTDPRPLFTSDFMGGAGGLVGAPQQLVMRDAGEPWRSARFYVPGADPYRGDPDDPKNRESLPDPAHRNPADPPRTLRRDVDPGAPRPAPPEWPTDAEILSAETYPTLAFRLQRAHNFIHDYIGGTIAFVHTAFRDPFVFLLHSNVDRLYARWQLTPGQSWRLDPGRVYGTHAELLDVYDAIDPWGGTGKFPLVRPWGPPENALEPKTYRDPSVVTPPAYEGQSLVRQITGVPTVVRINEGGFGPRNDFLDVEVVTRIDTAPDLAFGFQLRNDAGRRLHEGMLEVLRTGFTSRLPVLIDYQTFVGRKNGVIVRVALKT